MLLSSFHKNTLFKGLIEITYSVNITEYIILKESVGQCITTILWCCVGWWVSSAGLKMYRMLKYRHKLDNIYILHLDIDWLIIGVVTKKLIRKITQNTHWIITNR